MKKLFILLFFLSGIILNGQNYQNICTPGITLFKGSSGNIKAYRQDSVYLPGNNDTIFISYRTIRPFLVNGCYDTTNGSVLGRRIYKKHDGTFFFFNWKQDTLTIKTQAAMNDTWKFCDLPERSRIDAQVTNIYNDTVLGLPDEVKVLTFQARDLNGNNISHYLNQKTITLSQHYGISMTFDLYYMPDIQYNDASCYYLAGKTIPPLGIQNLSWKDIYNFDVGDEFHWSGGWWNGAGPTWNRIKNVIARQVYGNMDSVKYTMEICQILWLPQPPPNVETSHDTVIESYNFLTIGNNARIQNLPQTFQGGGYYHSSAFERNIVLPARQTQEYNSWGYSRYSGCWVDPFEPSYDIFHYSEGLGITYTFHQEYQLWPVNMSEAMVYYKKGSEVWGTPLAPNCSVLLPVTETTKVLIPDIKIIPNPVETVAEILYEGISQPGLHYILYNDFGQQVLIHNIHSNPFIFDRNGLSEGLYIISVLDDKNNILTSKKIMLR